MTNKYLSGAYPGGYTLSAAYDGLVIESSATVGGTGVTASFYTTITNYGLVNAAAGSYGVSLDAGGTLANGSAAEITALIEGYNGVHASGASATITNYGAIHVTGASYVVNGVRLDAGGTVTNGSAADNTALIEGYNGVRVSGASATITNFGTIHDTGTRHVVSSYDNCSNISFGVRLDAGGTVTNGSSTDATALIEGFYGIRASGALTTVTNYGTIQGPGNMDHKFGYISGFGYPLGSGVTLAAGGTVTNGSATDTAALIYGFFGVRASGASATIANFGTINGPGNFNGSFHIYGCGVSLDAGGSVTNGSAADTTTLIRGPIGIRVSNAPGTVINYGTIEGTNYPGVLLQAGGTLINGSATDTTAKIFGALGGGLAPSVYATGSATIINYGTIVGGVVLSSPPGGQIAESGAAGAGGVLKMEAGSASEGRPLNVGVGRIEIVSGSPTISGGVITSGKISGRGTLVLSGGVSSFNAGASLKVPKWSLTSGAVVNVNENLTFGGTFSDSAGTTLTVSASDTLTLGGAGSTLAGSVTGTGTLAFAGGTQALNSGASLGVANWSISGADVATLNENLTYAGTFTQGTGTTLTVATGDTLTLTGAATLGGTVNGAGTAKVSNATASGLTVGGTATLSDTGTVHQTGAVTLGDASSNVATLSIGVGAAWRIDNDSGIAPGTAKTSSIENSGLFIKSGGTGLSKIAVGITDNGTIEAASGTLDFVKAIKGAGTMAVDSGATLEVAKSAASTLHMNFNGGNAILALNRPAQFAATIGGFAATDTIDLLKTLATAATLGAGDTLVITNGATAVATLQLAGDYTGDTFNVTSDGKGGTNITVTTPGPVHVAPGVGSPLPHDQTAVSGLGHRFIDAMAGFGGDSHGPVSVFSEARYAHSLMLSVPRMAIS